MIYEQGILNENSCFIGLNHVCNLWGWANSLNIVSEL